MRIHYLVFATALLVFQAQATLRGGEPTTLADADVAFSATINSNVMLSHPVPSDFASFCYEVPCAPQMFSEKVHGGAKDFPKHPHLGPWAVRKSFVNLLKNLHTEGSKGPNIRIGGNSADRIQFSHLPPVRLDHPKNRELYNVLTVQDIATYAYASQWNGTVTIDLNILPENTTNSVEYAVAAMQLLDPKLIDGFEIGNEPQAFVHHGDKPKGWDYGDYNRLFKRYADALQQKGKMPMPRVQGAVFSGRKWQQHLDNYTRQWTTHGSVGSDHQNLLSSVSQHHYPIGKPRDATLEYLLSKETAKSVTAYASNAAFARERGIPFVIGEANACVFSDHNSVCNTFATALWSIDTMSWSAISNMSRWNFHGCRYPQPHTPVGINETLNAAVAKPLYYGMWFYSKLTAGGARFINVSATWTGVESQKGGNQNVVVWATKTSNKLRVAILQKTVRNATAISMTLELGANYGGASGEVLRLESGFGRMGEQNNITFAGQTLNNVADGIPRGTRTSESVHVDASGHVALTVQPFSAMLLVLDV